LTGYLPEGKVFDHFGVGESSNQERPSKLDRQDGAHPLGRLLL